MAIPDKELRECMRAVGALLEKRRPKPEIREHLDLRADIEGSELTISEVRPAYNDPKTIRHHAVAKAKWVNTQKRWQLYWMRADLKWHEYDADRPLRGIAEILAEVDRDPHGCFWG